MLLWVPSTGPVRLVFSPQPHIWSQDRHTSLHPLHPCLLAQLPPQPGPRRRSGRAAASHTWLLSSHRGTSPLAACCTRGGGWPQLSGGGKKTISAPRAPQDYLLPYTNCSTTLPRKLGRCSSPSHCDSPSAFAMVVRLLGFLDDFISPANAGFARPACAAGFTNCVSQQLWASVKSKANLGIITLSLTAPFNALRRRLLI